MEENNTQEKKDTVKDTAMENIWALSCYVPVFNIVTCTLCSIKMVHSKVCRFHARQGYVLFGLMFLTMFVPLISASLSFLIWILLLALHGVAMYFSYQKKEIRFPVLEKLAEKIPEYFVFTTLTGKNPEKETDSTLAPVVPTPVAPVQAPVELAPTPMPVAPTPAPAPVAPAPVAPVQQPIPTEQPAQPTPQPAQPTQPEPIPPQPTTPPAQEPPQEGPKPEEGGGSVQWTNRNR